MNSRSLALRIHNSGVLTLMPGAPDSGTITLMGDSA